MITDAISTAQTALSKFSLQFSTRVAGCVPFCRPWLGRASLDFLWLPSLERELHSGYPTEVSFDTQESLGDHTQEDQKPSDRLDCPTECHHQRGFPIGQPPRSQYHECRASNSYVARDGRWMNEHSLLLIESLQQKLSWPSSSNAWGKGNSE